MEKHSGYRSRQLTLITLSIAAAVLAIRLGSSSVLALGKDQASLERSVRIDPGNAEAKYRLARLYQLDMSADDERIASLYTESLRESPLFAPSWLGLAELYMESGDKKNAGIAVAAADKIIPASPGLLWESSMLSLTLGDNARALEKLRKVAQADPARRDRVFDVCRDMGVGREAILSGVVTPEALPDYIRYLIRKDLKDDTYPAWNLAVRDGVTDEGLSLAYVDYLIRSDDVTTARSIWDGLRPGHAGSGVWNGGFEADAEGRGFDWRMSEAEGVEVTYDYRNKTEGERSLKLEFSGEKNVDFHNVYQVIPVKTGSRYLLTSDITTEGITTRNGISWVVYCRSMEVSSDNYTGTRDWTEVPVAFDTPAECDYVGISLRRLKSDKLDNFISGEVWIDNVRLKYLGPVTGV